MTPNTGSLTAGEAFPAQSCSEAATPRMRMAWSARWVLMLVLVLSASAVVTVSPVIDPDIWWHLRTGEWVVEHGAVPVNDPFSTYGAGRPWVAYSWLFGVLIYALYKAFGLTGLVLYPVAGGLMLTLSLLWLVTRFEFRIPRALAFVAVGVAAMGPILAPRSYLFTIGFFTVEMCVLFGARRTGRTRELWILPPMFALWANVHIEFVHGLLAMGLIVVESGVAHVCAVNQTAGPRGVPLRPAILTTAACVLATLASPYGVAVYRPVLEYGAQRFIYQMVSELTAPDFRQAAHWVFLALAIGAAFTLGRQRHVEIFPVLLLVSGGYFSFNTGRDVWFLVVGSLAIIVSVWGDRRLPRPHLPWRSGIAAVLGTVGAIAAIASGRHLTPSTLEAAVAKKYPVAAVSAVKERGYPGPLYNTFDWGGFLIWQLPEHRVSMDGRTNVHGDERLRRSIRTWTGHVGWDSDEELRSARLVIGPVDAALTQLLRRDRRYELVYNDDVAMVFTRRNTL